MFLIEVDNLLRYLNELFFICFFLNKFSMYSIDFEYILCGIEILFMCGI